VRLQFLRNYGLGPASLLGRARGHPGRLKISRRRLKSFVAEVAVRPRVDLPTEAPGSIALIVPCFTHAAFLPEMLESIVSQTRPPDEVIFVDDCSPDATGEILQAFMAEHSPLAGRRFTLLVNDRNLGQAASLNLGIAAASSDLVMILNDDDYLMHDAVETILGFFREHREVALIGAGHVGFAGPDGLAAASKMSTAQAAPGLALVVHRPKDVLAYPFVDQLDMTHSGQAFLKMAWEAVGGYQTDKAKRVTPFSDRDFQFRVGALWPVAVAVGTPLAFWRNDSSVDAGRNS
jgi:glycosyltransferase involved in cell wall biosynthesis